MYLIEEAHLNHIDQILQIINDYDLKMSLSKFMFNVSEHQIDGTFHLTSANLHCHICNENT